METFIILCTIVTTPWGGPTKFERYLTSSVQQCSNYFSSHYSNGLHQWEPYRLPRNQFELEQKCGPNNRDCSKVGAW
jgi:hypothetical protein